MIIECPGCQYRYDVTGQEPGTRARCRCGTIFAIPEPPRAASYLQCPQCAAAIDPNSTHCGYCSAQLLVKACPRCLGKMFHGHTHCGHCGARLEGPAEPEWDQTNATRPCPVCRHHECMLERRQVGAIVIEECSECDGTFVDAATFERLISDRRLASATEAAGLGRRQSKIRARESTPKPRPMYIKCPECGGTMNRKNYARVSGVIIQVCTKHGTWFDVDGLPRVIEFIREGGLDRAARREHEIEREELRRARAEAAAERVRDEVVHGYSDPSLRRARSQERFLQSIAEVLADGDDE